MKIIFTSWMAQIKKYMIGNEINEKSTNHNFQNFILEMNLIDLLISKIVVCAIKIKKRIVFIQDALCACSIFSVSFSIYEKRY